MAGRLLAAAATECGEVAGVRLDEQSGPIEAGSEEGQIGWEGCKAV